MDEEAAVVFGKSDTMLLLKHLHFALGQWFVYLIYMVDSSENLSFPRRCT
jgi:hypothetical protein